MERIYCSLEPFDLPGHGDKGQIGILMIHGFTGSPSDFRRVGYFLNDMGYSVHALRLPGHGTTPEDMIMTGWADWWKHVLDTYDELKSQYDQLFVIGYSMGGLLSLRLSMERELDGLISVAAPIYLQSRTSVFAILVQYFVKYIDKKITIGPQLFEEAWAYDKTPVPCIVSLRRLLKQVKSNLHNVHVPIFIMQGERDGTVRPRSASYINERVSSKRKELKYYSQSSHALLLDHDRDMVYEDIKHFLQSLVRS